MTIKEVLDSAREAALEIRRMEEESELRRQQIGVQGHSYGAHSKNGIRDPMRKVIELIDWEKERIASLRLNDAIEEGYEIVAGLEKVTDPATVEVLTRYYLQGESWMDIVSGKNGVGPISERIDLLVGHKYDTQVKILSSSIDGTIQSWESIGIAHLKEMGR